MSPDIPGYCVREKELKPCSNHDDCIPGRACSKLEGTSQKYCMEKRHPDRDRGFYKLLTFKGGLGRYRQWLRKADHH